MKVDNLRQRVLDGSRRALPHTANCRRGTPPQTVHMFSSARPDPPRHAWRPGQPSARRIEQIGANITDSAPPREPRRMV